MKNKQGKDPNLKARNSIRLDKGRLRKHDWLTRLFLRLAHDIQNALPEVKGFSERNISHMIRFAREYGPRPILQQSAAKHILGVSEYQLTRALPKELRSSLPTVEEMEARLAELTE